MPKVLDVGFIHKNGAPILVPASTLGLVVPVVGFIAGGGIKAAVRDTGRFSEFVGLIQKCFLHPENKSTATND